MKTKKLPCGAVLVATDDPGTSPGYVELTVIDDRTTFAELDEDVDVTELVDAPGLECDELTTTLSQVLTVTIARSSLRPLAQFLTEYADSVGVPPLASDKA